MDEKKYRIGSNSIRLLVAISRLAHLLIFLVISAILVFLIVYFVEIDLKEKLWENLADIVHVLEYGTISTFAIMAFKNILSGKADDLIEYLLTDDISPNDFSESKWVFLTKKSRGREINRFIDQNVMHRYAFRISIYFIIISLAGWLAYLAFADKKNIATSSKPSNYYYFFNHSIEKNPPVWEGNPSDFKLIFSFEHEKTNIDAFGKDESETLINLLKALKGCLQSPKDLVELKIIGFASEYQNDIDKKHEDIKLANKRASVIANKIEAFKSEKEKHLPHLAKIKIEVHQWSLLEYDEMVKARIFKETNLEGATEKQQQDETSEYLNRRAEVIISEAGGCSR
ncbi:hypothetical protein [Winogradskyella sp. 3972H.M.0a.05]|uniref:hypothetical protein n=1 Tax=Winogradskyella sp. 3972H.M.0a.05 TaxID=2950277 RepID=UPI003398CF26